MQNKAMNVHFNFVMDEETDKMLTELSELAQRKKADYLRILIKMQYDMVKEIK